MLTLHISSLLSLKIAYHFYRQFLDLYSTLFEIKKIFLKNIFNGCRQAP